MATTAAAPAAISPRDFLGIDSVLSDEERDIRDTIRAFVGDRVLPKVGDWFERAEFPTSELAPELGKLGVLGMHLEGYGCAGASATAYGLACMELEAGDSGLRSLVSVQGSLAMYRDLALGQRGAEAASGCRGWRRARRSAASDSPSPTLALTPARCAPRRAATAATGYCTVRRCGSPTARLPTWPSCGR